MKTLSLEVLKKDDEVRSEEQREAGMLTVKEDKQMGCLKDAVVEDRPHREDVLPDTLMPSSGQGNKHQPCEAITIPDTDTIIQP